ncbi:hypothetical protein [Nocardia sp. alder85J]|uniref:hypothetical protein n=1 Tax=Nocardia sp. alder85J TaxID=2862949 RepID=UPI001CD29C35|nr:hypothetical protein [Nocardia sp. alder85J]MCX4092173.1 hypothetical protein [Nocardia sp. alder85J]
MPLADLWIPSFAGLIQQIETLEKGGQKVQNDQDYVVTPEVAGTLKDNFQQLYNNVGDLYYGLGNASKTTPKLSNLRAFNPDMSQLTGAEALLVNYGQIVADVNKSADNLNTADQTVIDTVKTYGDQATALKGSINSMLEDMTAKAGNPPDKANETEIEYVAGYLADAIETYAKDAAGIQTEAQTAANNVKTNTPTPTDPTTPTPATPTTSSPYSNYSPTTSSPYTSSPYSSNPYDGYTPVTSNTTGNGTTTGGTATDPYGTGNTGTGSTGTNPYGTDTGSNATPASAGTSAGDPGIGSMMDSLLPMLMSGLLNRQQADPTQNTDPYANDPYRDRYGQYPQNAQQQPTQQQTQPGQSSSSQAAPAQGPTSGATSDQPTNNVPAGRTPGPDGTVTYTFPDGQTQKVSVTVAKALDAAFGNQKDTDAQTAYAGTSAKWTDKKQIGARVDPYQLMTGDIATWENATAIVRVMGSGTDGTLDVIVDGQLKPFAPDMSGATGEFGEFTGFQHPNGIEVSNATDTSGTGNGTTGVAGDPSGGTAAAAAPTVAAPA